MNVELTDEERRLILEMLDKLTMSGIDTLRLAIQLYNKLKG